MHGAVHQVEVRDPVAAVDMLPSLVLLLRPVVGEQQRQHEVGGRGLAQGGHQLQPARGPAVAQQDLDTRREAARRHWAHSWIK